MAGKEKDNYQWPEVWRVKREYNNFDLCVVAYDQYGKDNDNEKIDDDDDFRILFVIENKVKSIPYKEQLERYAREAEEKNLAYWKNRGNDIFENALKEYGNNDDKYDGKYWIGIENGSWVLKKGIKSESGRKTIWSEVKKMSVTSGEKGKKKKNKTNFLECYVKQEIAKEPPIHFILLSLAKKFPGYENDGVWKVKMKDSKDNEKEIDWKVCNYFDYKSKIKEAFENVSNGLYSQIINDYCKFIECLTTLSSKWEKDYGEAEKFLSKNENYKDAHQFRIHDLYQKLKFSYLCTRLFNIINNNYGTKSEYEYTVYPSNQAGLFKEKKTEFKSSDKYICVNYTYLHGDPLLEINVHPICENGVELYYAIQVQGNAYEHGIQVKKNDDTIKILKKQQGEVFSETVWKSLEEKEISIISDWMNIKPFSSWKKAGWMVVPDRENKGYNKYDMNDGTYVYQKYIINEDVTIKKVLDQMLCDLETIILHV